MDRKLDFQSLADDVALYRSFQGAQESLIRRSPEALKLRRDVEKATERNDMKAVDRRIREFLEEDQSWLLDRFAQMVAEACRDKRSLMPFPQAHMLLDTPFSVVQVENDGTLAIQLVAVFPNDFRKPRRGKTIQFSGQTDYYKIISGLALSFKRWECPRFDDESELRNMECAAADTLSLEPGEILCTDGRQESISIESVVEPTVHLQVSYLVDGADVRVDFDADTMKFKEAHPRNVLAARRMYLLSALRNLGVKDRVSALEESAASGPFYQRWYAAARASLCGFRSGQTCD